MHKISDEKYDKILKDKSSDEFGVMRGKLKDKSLYNFSKREKQVIKDTEDSIDQMYSYVQKQLNEVQKDFFTTAIEKGQSKAKQLVLTK